MTSTVIQKIITRDCRFPIGAGAGTDAVHADPVYSYAVTELATDHPDKTGVGLVFTLGSGNDIVCRVIEALAQELVGQEVDQLMANFGTWTKRIADHPQWRWLGPHKGVVHLALASVVNACFDLWAKTHGVPLWQKLLDATPKQLVSLLDLSGVEDVLTAQEAEALLTRAQQGRSDRMQILRQGYPGYDTSVGWFGYDDDKIASGAKQARECGFTAVKLKVGSKEGARDVRRAERIREAVGDEALVMLDANQQWSVPQALQMGLALSGMRPYWLEEPCHPDDIIGHQTLARALSPLKIATGEHCSNRVLFKNLLLAGATSFVQADCTRLAGVSEFLVVSLMARKLNLPVVPHVGDMGQIHQHLVLFNHIAMDHDALFLEYIPHLREHFQDPAQVEEGHYRVPQSPGASSDLVDAP